MREGWSEEQRLYEAATGDAPDLDASRALVTLLEGRGQHELARALRERGGLPAAPGVRHAPPVAVPLPPPRAIDGACLQTGMRLIFALLATAAAAIAPRLVARELTHAQRLEALASADADARLQTARALARQTDDLRAGDLEAIRRALSLRTYAPADQRRALAVLLETSYLQTPTDLALALLDGVEQATPDVAFVAARELARRHGLTGARDPRRALWAAADDSDSSPLQGAARARLVAAIEAAPPDVQAALLPALLALGEEAPRRVAMLIETGPAPVAEAALGFVDLLLEPGAPAEVRGADRATVERLVERARRSRDSDAQAAARLAGLRLGAPWALDALMANLRARAPQITTHDDGRLEVQRHGAWRSRWGAAAERVLKQERARQLPVLRVLLAAYPPAELAARAAAEPHPYLAQLLADLSGRTPGGGAR